MTLNGDDRHTSLVVRYDAPWQDGYGRSLTLQATEPLIALSVDSRHYSDIGVMYLPDEKALSVRDWLTAELKRREQEKEADGARAQPTLDPSDGEAVLREVRERIERLIREASENERIANETGNAVYAAQCNCAVNELDGLLGDVLAMQRGEWPLREEAEHGRP